MPGHPTAALVAGIDDWEEKKDPSTGRSYWYSRSRRESRWSKPASSTKGPPLPAGWAEVIDPSSGKTYYYNESLKKSVWTRPAPPASELPEGWTENKDPKSGRTYYYNAVLRQSSWTFPTADQATSSAAAGGAGGAGGASGGGKAARGGGKGGKKGAEGGGKKKRQIVFAETLETDADYTPPVYPKSDSAKELLRGILSGMFLFSGLGSSQLEQLVDAMQRQECEPGLELIKQGDKGDNFYVVESGEFDIIVEGPGKVATRGAGTSFGELALMYNAPRNATCKASVKSVVWALDRVTFRYMIANSEGDKKTNIIEGLRKVPLLSNLDAEQMSRVADVVEVVEYKEGDFIIRKGDVGEEFFMVNQGDVKCTGIIANGKPAPDVPLTAGAYFGERALLKSQPRAANVVAASPSVVCFKLGRKAFTDYLGPLHDLLDKNMIDHVLQTIECLSGMSRADREKVIAGMRVVTFGDSKTILSGGRPNNSLYVLKEGQAVVIKKARVVRTIEEKGHFGEEGLLKDTVYDYDVVSKGPCTLFTIQRGELETLVRPVAEIQAAAKAAAPPPPAPRRVLRDDIKLSDLVEVALLGCGAFGRVTLMRHKSTNKAYALKRISKQHVWDTKQVKNIMFEKEMMTRCLHPFILRLEATYQDRDSLYMLTEVAPGGEMFNMLADTEDGIIEEDACQFYTGCVVSALECMHAQRIVYRDMKTENLMLDVNGYLKVIDLGFAKVVEGKTYTLCGTPEYMAPEVVLGKGHDIAVDYWALGILVYEMVCGETPFADENMDNMKVCKKIVEDDLIIPEDLTDEIADFIANLLERNPTARLGARRGGIDEIWAHPYMETLDDVALTSKSLPAPWKPPCKNDFDLVMFSEAEDSLGARVARYKGDPKAFEGF